MLKELDDKWNEISPNLLMYNFSVPEQKRDAVSSEIKKFYFNEKPISKETVNQLIQVRIKRPKTGIDAPTKSLNVVFRHTYLPY